MKGADFQKSFYSLKDELQVISKKASSFGQERLKREFAAKQEMDERETRIKNRMALVFNTKSDAKRADKIKKQELKPTMPKVKWDSLTANQKENEVDKLRVKHSKQVAANKDFVNFNVKQMEYDLVKAAINLKIFENMSDQMFKYKQRKKEQAAFG